MNCCLCRGLFPFALLISASVGLAQTVDVFPQVYPGVPRINAPFTIQIEIHDAGTLDATNVIATNVLPAGLTLISASVVNYWERGNPPYQGILDTEFAGGVTNYGNVVRCNAGRILANDFYRSLYITARCSTPGTYSNFVSVTCAGTDSQPGNNQLWFPLVVHPPALSVSGGQSIPEQSGSNATFNVWLSSSNSATVTVDYRTIDGTATAGQDYQAVSGTLTFPPGVTNRIVSVPVLDDNLAEAASQSFTLQLSNAINAELPTSMEYDYVLDNEPPLQFSVADAAPVLEGDSGFTSAIFVVSLSEAADVPVSVDFSASPYVNTNGTLTFPAGITNLPLNILIAGNLTVETDRVFQVTLSNPQGVPGALISRAVGQGTIIDDDALPGKYHHVSIDPVPTPQIAGRPFPVTVRLKDYFNNPATNTSLGVSLVAYAFTNYTTTIIQAISLDTFTQGVAVGIMTYTNAATNASIAAWPAYGSPVGGNGFKVVPPPQLFLSLPASSAEGAGVLAGAGVVSITNVDSVDNLVSLSSSDTQGLTVPPSVLIPAGQTSAVFDVTIVDNTKLDGTHTPYVFASATNYLSTLAGISILDNESATLYVTLPPIMYEAKGSNTAQATVTCSAPPSSGILVYLSCNNNARLTFGTPMAIQAGHTSTVFTVTVPDNTLLDGAQLVTLTAHVPNWVDGSATTMVLDDDTNITVTTIFGNDILVEGLGLLTNRLQITLGGYTSNNVIVQLTSSNPSKLVVPSSITILAGQRTATTNFTLPDDGLFDGTQTVTITGSAPGFLSGSRSVTVFDNDVHHFSFSAIGVNQSSGVPFQVTVSAKDVNGTNMDYFTGKVFLSLIPGGNAAAVTPLVISNFSRGSWTGSVTVNGGGTNLQLLATATNGMSSASGPFTIPAPSWAADLRISRVQPAGADLQIYFNTYTGHVYQVQKATNFPPSWLPIGSPQPGIGGESSIMDTGSVALPFRVYRLGVSP